ncbi:hypothetical protein QBC47DRAFT_61278 [Echria macrotheca]|uniref:Uncharacterized protein n=1 Tax=Echria macrotheca TaxID=438768 RepID=A0AAJ0B6I9_9PEZI|nr:hypothetical protein QBC47DRAFT_61278 [Echria macrotheca]
MRLLTAITTLSLLQVSVGGTSSAQSLSPSLSLSLSLSPTTTTTTNIPSSSTSTTTTTKPTPPPKETDLCLQRKFLSAPICTDLDPSLRNTTLSERGWKCCWDMVLSLQGNPHLSYVSSFSHLLGDLRDGVGCSGGKAKMDADFWWWLM